ncbi:MAG: STN domain-containing protein [Saprospiraceae bacterium]
MKPFLTIYIFFLLPFCLMAQPNVLDKRVTMHYTNERLHDALQGISNRYDVYFSYSSDLINMRQRVSAHLDNEPLSIGLDQLFANTYIVYAAIGGQIVLRVNKDKTLTSSDNKESRKKKLPPEKEEIEQPVFVKIPPPTSTPTGGQTEEEPVPAPDSIILLTMPDIHTIRSEGPVHPFDKTLLNFEKWRTEADWTLGEHSDYRIAQLSLFPMVSTNIRYSRELTNNVSLNLLWGVNGGVDGLELGTLVNTVRKDVKGFQAAGLGNTVRQNVTGTQMGGLFNVAGGTARGFQAAGLFNKAKNAEAAQAAGLMNLVSEDISGIQAAGLFNHSGGNANALQAAGLFNSNKGRAKVQISSLFNKAGDVDIAQVSTLMNISRGHVRGVQIALINVSDTVSGVPIGLLNIVKHGYNKFEIYGSESLHGNIQLKLGANRFYNIFHVGARIPKGSGLDIWGVGYGIGTVATLSEKNHLNFELTAIHINEYEAWTNKLNTIGQFRFTWNHQLGRNVGFFIGPTANAMVSQLKDPETGKFNSEVPPYSIVNEDLTDNLNLKGWVGLNAGFRF